MKLKAGEAMLEVTPPALRASPEAVSRAVDRVAAVVQRVGDRVDYLNVPEIVAENRDGMPLYRNMDVCEFASLLNRKTGKSVVVNKVVVFFDFGKEFEEWARKTANGSYGISHLVLVGGNSPQINYPGPTVLQADEFASKLNGVKVGNICIPERESEAERVIAKTKAGCSFFTTQVILEPTRVNSLLEGYASECTLKGVKPACFFLSFAPVGDLQDLQFLKWLGARVPSGVEERLKKSGDLGGESIDIAAEVFGDILSFARKKAGSVPLGLNIEPVSMHNLGVAEEMLLRLSDRMRQRYGLATDHISSNMRR